MFDCFRFFKPGKLERQQQAFSNGSVVDTPSANGTFLDVAMSWKDLLEDFPAHCHALTPITLLILLNGSWGERGV